MWFKETLCVLDGFTLGRYVHDDIAYAAKSKTIVLYFTLWLFKMGVNHKTICLQKKANLLYPAQFYLQIFVFLHNKV